MLNSTARRQGVGLFRFGEHAIEKAFGMAIKNLGDAPGFDQVYAVAENGHGEKCQIANEQVGDSSLSSLGGG